MAITVPYVEKNVELLQHLQDAFEHGELTQENLKEIITLEARELGMTYDEAMEAARLGTLPRTLLGYDIRFLSRLVVR